MTPNLVTYWDGGYTQARFNQINLFTDTVPSFRFLGGGTEYALNMDWFPIRGLFWRTEYRYSSYQSADIAIVPLAITGTAEHMQKDVHTVTTSLMWRFNWGGSY